MYMLTKSDIALLEKRFVTIELFSETMKKVATKEDVQEIKDMMVESLARQEAIEQERTALAYRQSKHSDQLDNHEKRIARAEQKLAIVL